MERVEEHNIEGQHGKARLRILIPIETHVEFCSTTTGGWVIGSIDEYDTVARKLAERTSCTVVLVEYRLAPEHRFPTAVDDSYVAPCASPFHTEDLVVLPRAVILTAEYDVLRDEGEA